MADQQLHMIVNTIGNIDECILFKATDSLNVLDPYSQIILNQHNQYAQRSNPFRWYSNEESLEQKKVRQLPILDRDGQSLIGGIQVCFNESYSSIGFISNSCLDRLQLILTQLCAIHGYPSLHLFIVHSGGSNRNKEQQNIQKCHTKD